MTFAQVGCAVVLALIGVYVLVAVALLRSPSSEGVGGTILLLGIVAFASVLGWSVDAGVWSAP